MRTAEEWGRLAVSLPGWRWMPGMYAVSTYASLPRTVPGFTRISSSIPSLWLQTHNAVPDPDDPATAGCLFALLGGPDTVAPEVERYVSEGPFDDITSLGRACIAAAEQLGRWPGARLPIPAGLGG
jgi:hypothetical protein